MKELWKHNTLGKDSRGFSSSYIRIYLATGSEVECCLHASHWILSKSHMQDLQDVST